MEDKLLEIENKYNELKEKMYDPVISSDLQQMTEISKKMSEIEDIYYAFQELKKHKESAREAKEILETEQDAEMIEMAKSQLDEANHNIEEQEKNIHILLVPKDPLDDKNIFLEIRPAAGGDEAGLFAAELMRMYLLYSQRKGLKADIIDQDFSDIGGLKSATIKISGKSVYSLLKFESGVHRVQRIPATESQGRVHTSTVTVAIMPEIEDVEVHIDPKDIRMETYAASSSGGQNANKNQTGVRIHHNPTGIIVNIGDSKSQLQNKERAFQILRAKLFQMESERKQQESRDIRGAQIGTGERSEKIRTYNFPQDRLTDHRMKESRGNLPGIMAGNIDDIITAMILNSQAQQLSS